MTSRWAMAVAGVSAWTVALGIALIHIPSGVIAFGIEGMAAAYLIAYYAAKTGGRK